MLRTLGTSLAALALLAASSSAQAEPRGREAQSAAPSLRSGSRAATSPFAAIARGSRTVLVDDIPSAENLLFLSDGRLLVSGDKGLYLLTRDASGAVTAQNLAPSAPCAFGGLVEVRGTVYANCYDFSRAFIYASALDPLAFTEAVELKNSVIGNGLTSDGTYLYSSATLQSKINRVTIDPADPRTLTDQTTIGGPLETPLPNGLKVLRGALVWTDLMSVKTAPLDRSAPPRNLATRATLLDDLYVDELGILACDYTGNVLVAYDPAGKQVAQTPAVFKSPSAVLPANGRLGFGPTDLIVTERGGGVVSVYRPE